MSFSQFSRGQGRRWRYIMTTSQTLKLSRFSFRDLSGRVVVRRRGREARLEASGNPEIRFVVFIIDSVHLNLVGTVLSPY